MGGWGVCGAYALRGTVNGLVRSVRQRNRATVIFDPMSDATASTAILGGTGDKLYLRDAVQVLDDGFVQVALKRVMPVRPGLKGMPTVRPDVDVVVLSGTRTSRALGQYRFRLTNVDGVHDAHVQVPGPSDAAGVLAGLAVVLHGHRDATVAVKAVGLLHVAQLLADDVKPRLVLMHDAVAKLGSCWSWTVQNLFVVGVPLSQLQPRSQPSCNRL